MSLTARVLTGLAAGLAVGIVLALLAPATAPVVAAWIEPVGLLWVNALRMTVIPLVFAGLVMGAASARDGRSIGRLGARASRATCDAVTLEGEEAVGQGGAVVMWAQCEHTVLGAGRVAERGLRAEVLGETVGTELAADLDAGAALDFHAADQMPVYLALAGGPSSFTTRELTEHARTAMWLIEQFLPVRFATSREGELTRISTSPV